MSQLISLFGHIDDWFRDLQPIDQFNLKDIDNIQDEESQLDALAKDLELLLEQDEIIEPEIYFFEQYPTDELALVDSSIGHCYTIEDTHKKCKSASPNDYSIVKISQLESCIDNREQKSDLKKTTITPMPRDHDYLARVKQSNRHCSRSHLKRSIASDMSHEVSTVLNTNIMKRFARYSEKLRVLSGQACN